MKGRMDFRGQLAVSTTCRERTVRGHSPEKLNIELRLEGVSRSLTDGKDREKYSWQKEQYILKGKMYGKPWLDHGAMER